MCMVAVPVHLQDPSIGKRMLDNYGDILFATHLQGTKRQLEGSYDVAGVKWADAEKMHIMSLQVRGRCGMVWTGAGAKRTLPWH